MYTLLEMKPASLNGKSILVHSASRKISLCGMTGSNVTNKKNSVAKAVCGIKFLFLIFLFNHEAQCYLSVALLDNLICLEGNAAPFLRVCSEVHRIRVTVPS